MIASLVIHYHKPGKPIFHVCLKLNNWPMCENLEFSYFRKFFGGGTPFVRDVVQCWHPAKK